MYNKVSKYAVLVLLAALVVMAFSGCDLIMNLIGGKDNEDEPIALPASVAADPDYADTETALFTAINKDRTDHSATAFGARDASLDALARRYASVEACDTAENLKDRAAAAVGSCSDAVYFLGGGTSLTNYVDNMMSGWLGNPGGQASMRNSGFTKIGIGMAEVPGHANLLPGDTWHSVVVLLVKP